MIRCGAATGGETYPRTSPLNSLLPLDLANPFLELSALLHPSYCFSHARASDAEEPMTVASICRSPAPV